MIKKIQDNIWQLYFKEFGSCVYLLKLNNKVILIDTSSNETRQELLNNLKELNITTEDIDIVLITHNHYDHIENIELFKHAKINPTIPEIKVIPTPGHTHDSKCFLYKDILFSGDTIFHHGGIGRTDFPESSEQDMKKSLEKLSKIQYKTLCPGHII